MMPLVHFSELEIVNAIYENQTFALVGKVQLFSAIGNTY